MMMVTPLLAEAVGKHPTAVAVVDARGTTTWSELDTRVQHLVAGLRARGLSEGDTVAVLLGNQVEMVEVSLACMQAGWLLVPLNWHLVADEVRYVLDDARACAIVVDHRWQDVVVSALSAPGAAGARLLVIVDHTSDRGTAGDPAGDSIGTAGDAGVELESYAEVVATPLADDDPPEWSRGGPMFYTSGTTGHPKGVRGALAQLGGPPEIWTLMAHSLRSVIDLPDEGGGAQGICGPMYHSAQWVISMFALMCGATLVLQHRFDAEDLLDLIDEHRVTNLHLVPTQMSRLLQVPEQRRDRFDGSTLESVLHGAAPCPPSVKRSMIEWLGPIVTEYYGGTEGGFISRITAAEWAERPGSVGMPLEVIEIVVVDPLGAVVGPGIVGDLYFRSLLGSSFEYHNAEEKTRAVHLEPGLATLGDIGYLDDDGYLFLSDRRIDMVVSGGVNIYPAEIEAVLVAADEVADAAVFGIPDQEMGESVRAALVLRAGLDWSDEVEAAVTAHCREHLAGYKCPRGFEVHTQLPRSEAGKLLKRLLRDPWWASSGRSI